MAANYGTAYYKVLNVNNEGLGHYNEMACFSSTHCTKCMRAGGLTHYLIIFVSYI